MKPVFHDLKTWPDFFNAIAKGEKTFEIRKDDRGYRAGDTLNLREFIPGVGYTGRKIVAHVPYIYSGIGLQKDFVVMSIIILENEYK